MVFKINLTQPQCPFASIVWSGVVQHLGLPNVVPTAASTLPEWWPLALMLFPLNEHKKANSLLTVCSGTFGWKETLKSSMPNKRPHFQLLNATIQEWEAWLTCRGGRLQELE
jgi:hypothetical protein